MRVLHCIPNMSGGGAERQLCILAQAQRSAGHDVHVALIQGGPNLARLEQSGAVIHWIPARNSYDPQILFGLRSVMKRVAPDIVQTWLLQMDVAAGFVAGWMHLPWILSERSSGRNYARSAKAWLRLKVSVFVRAVVANSQMGAAYWRAMRGDRLLTVVVRNAAPIAEIASVSPASLPTTDPRPLILFAGRFVQQKNLTLLVDVLHEVFLTVDARALLCGEGPEVETLQQRVEELSIGGRVEIDGYRDDLWSLMRSAAVFVSISLYEGHPNTVLEAMASRCPLVVSDIQEHREFLDESAAWLVPPTDVHSVAKAIVEAVERPDTAALRAETAWNRVQCYAASACEARYAEVYRTVLACGGGRDR